jgi:hypothetical protein
VNYTHSNLLRAQRAFLSVIIYPTGAYLHVVPVTDPSSKVCAIAGIRIHSQRRVSLSTFHCVRLAQQPSVRHGLDAHYKAGGILAMKPLPTEKRRRLIKLPTSSREPHENSFGSGLRRKYSTRCRRLLISSSDRITRELYPV